MSIEMSVITVCRNSAAVLPRMLESLRAQTWQAREWVVVDGASTDGTLDLVAGSGERLGDWVSEPDAGIYDAMNKGIARARGEVVYFLNSDDELHDAQVLATVAARFAAEPALDLLVGEVVYRFADGRLIHRNYDHVDARSIAFLDLCHQAVFARLSLFARIGGFREEFRINADYDWLIRAFRAGAKVGRLNHEVAFFAADGAHTRDRDATEAERERVRAQYVGPVALGMGLLEARIANRWHLLKTGQPRGCRLLGEARA